MSDINAILQSKDFTPSEVAEIKEFGLDSSKTRPSTIQKATNSAPLSILPDSLAQTALGKGISSGLNAIDNLLYGSFSIPSTNWGGAYYSAGRTFAKNEVITPKDLEVKPLNEADKLYQLHDVDFQEAGTKNTYEDRFNAYKNADRKFIERAEQRLKEGDLTTYEKFLLNSSILAFKAKVASGIGYSGYAENQITADNALQAGDILYSRNRYRPEVKPVVWQRRVTKPALRSAENLIENYKNYQSIYVNPKKERYIDEIDSLSF